MKRLAALIFILSLLLVPASAHAQEEVYTFPIEFTALASGTQASASLFSLPQTGTFNPPNPPTVPNSRTPLSPWPPMPHWRNSSPPA